MMTGWTMVNGTWYYLNPVTQGNTGWQNTEDGSGIAAVRKAEAVPWAPSIPELQHLMVTR